MGVVIKYLSWGLENFFKFSNKIWYPTLQPKSLLGTTSRRWKNISYSLTDSLLKEVKAAYLIAFILKKNLLHVLALQ